MLKLCGSLVSLLSVYRWFWLLKQLSFIGSETKVLVFPVTADEMSESRQTHVTLHDIDPQALEQLVQYAYTAEIMVGEGNVQVGWKISAFKTGIKVKYT